MQQIAKLAALGTAAIAAALSIGNPPARAQSNLPFINNQVPRLPIQGTLLDPLPTPEEASEADATAATDGAIGTTENSAADAPTTPVDLATTPDLLEEVEAIVNLSIR